jgi:hypothetical protein
MKKSKAEGVESDEGARAFGQLWVFSWYAAFVCFWCAFG